MGYLDRHGKRGVLLASAGGQTLAPHPEPSHLPVMRPPDPQDCVPVAILPGGELALLAQAELAKLGERGGFSLEQVEHDPLQPRQVVRGVILAHGGGVFQEIDVQHPVDAIIDAPMRPDGFGKVDGRHDPERNVVASGMAVISLLLSLTFS